MSLPPVARTEHPVADRVRDIEVVTRHQALVVMHDVVLAKALNERQPPDQRSRVGMVSKVQQFVIQEIQNCRQQEQEQSDN